MAEKIATIVIANLTVNGYLSSAGEVRKIEKDITIRTSVCNQTDTEIKDPGTMLLDRDGLRVFGKYVEAGFRPSRYVILYSEYNFDTTESNEIRASVPNTNFGNIVVNEARLTGSVCR